MKLLRNRRVASFTIMELTVVIAISSILIAGVYYSFHFFNRLYYGFNEQRLHAEQLYQFEKQLRKEFQEAPWVLEDGQKVRMLYPEKAIEYCFYPAYLLRQQASRIDTIHLGTSGFQVEEVENRQGQRLIKGIKASFSDQAGKEQHLYLSREYTPEDLLKKVK